MTVVPFTPQPLGRPSLISTMDDVFQLAETIANTDFVPRGLRGNQPAIIAAILYGREVGLEPMTSLSTIAVIDGKPTMAAEAQRALILAAGHELTLEEATNTRATWAGRRANDRTTTRVTWTLDDAKRAKLAGRPAWQAYPRAMLSARASAELARAIFADVIRGMAASEELVDVAAADVETPGPVTESAETAKPATRRRRRVGTSASGSSPASREAEPEPTPRSDPSASQDRPAEPSEPAGGQPEPEPEHERELAEPDDAPAEPDKPNKAQLGMMFALYTEKGIADRDAKLAYAERVLERKIDSSKELSALDVSRIISALNAEPTPRTEERPTQHPADLPPDEQAVLDALVDEFDAKLVDEGGFPEGY